MKQRLAALFGVLALLATSACGGHGGSSSGSNLTPYAGNIGPASFDWRSDELRGATLIGAANAPHMQVTVMVKQQNLAALISYAQQVSDPSSPLYRHFLTPQEIANRFGATQQDYQATADYFVQRGLSVAGWPQRLGLVVAGNQGAMEKAFGTKFGLYEKDGEEFVAPMSTPHFASAVPVIAVRNLVTLNRIHRYLLLPPRANANYSLGYSPQQVQKAFDFTGAYGKGYKGNGITIGIIATGPINTPRNNLCADADLAALKSLYNNVQTATVCEEDVTPTEVSAGLAASGIPTAPPASPNPVGNPSPAPGHSSTDMFPYSGDFQPAPPVTSAGCGKALSSGGGNPNCNPEDGEAQLDTQTVATLAPGSNVKFYLAYNANDCYVFYPNSCATPPPAPATPAPNGNYGQPILGLYEADAEIQEAIAKNEADVISISYGGGEPDNIGQYFDSAGVGYEPAEFAELAAEGIAVFVSSGDDGSAECLSSNAAGYAAKQCVSYPSGDVNVTSVGGVNAPLDEFGQLTTNITAWGTTTSLGTSGSGGGISQTFSAPSWQKAAINPSPTMRTQPDVAMLADPFTGVTIYANAGLSGDTNIPSGAFPIGGTSLSAPQMAAMWALVLQACLNTTGCGNSAYSAHPYRLGNAAPYFYSIYKGSNLTNNVAFTPHLPYSQVFYDVLYGTNAMKNPGNSVTATPIPGQLAGPGYDQTTGVGVPFAGHLIQAVTGTAVP